MSLPPLVKANDQIKASDWNALIRELDRLNKLVGAGQISGGGSMEESGIEIMVKNSSGVDRVRWQALGITGQLYVDTPYQDQPRVLDCTTPTFATHFGRFVILKEPISIGCLGRAWISGTCLARVNIADVNHTSCDVQDSSTTLLSSASNVGSAQILWKSTSGTGNQFCLIRFPVNDTSPQLAKLQAAPGATTASVKLIKVVNGVAVVVGNAFNVKVVQTS